MNQKKNKPQLPEKLDLIDLYERFLRKNMIFIKWKKIN